MCCFYLLLHARHTVAVSSSHLIEKGHWQHIRTIVTFPVGLSRVWVLVSEMAGKMKLKTGTSALSEGPSRT